MNEPHHATLLRDAEERASTYAEQAREAAAAANSLSAKLEESKDRETKARATLCVMEDRIAVLERERDDARQRLMDIAQAIGWARALAWETSMVGAVARSRKRSTTYAAALRTIRDEAMAELGLASESSFRQACILKVEEALAAGEVKP